MKKCKLKNSLLLVALLSFCVSYSQESINAGGGDIDAPSGSIAYSIGQVVYTTKTDNAAAVAEGVQQAFEIYTLSVEDPTKDISMSVYPNPTAHQIFLRIGNYQQEKMNYQIYDLNGKKVGQGKITAQETSINMSDFASAPYLIYVLDQDNQTNQTFKIIKK